MGKRVSTSAPSFFLLLATVAILAVASMTACDEGDPVSSQEHLQADLGQVAASAPRDEGDSQSTANTIAQSIAVAMQSPSVATGVRDAMRDAPFHDHKLHFDRWLTSRHGQELLRSASAFLGITEGAYLQLLRDLPDFEFYVPIKQHRLSWQPGDSYLVAAVTRPNDFIDPLVTTYDESGRAVVLDVVEKTPDQALFALLPIEADFSRPDVPPRGYRGNHIQSENECHPLALGCQTTTRWQDPGDFSTGQFVQPGIARSDGRIVFGRLYKFELTRERDGGIGSNEVEFWYWKEGSSEDPGGGFAGQSSPTVPCKRFTGIEANTVYQLNIDLDQYYPTSSSELGSEFWEDDDGACSLDVGEDDLIGRPDGFSQPQSGTAISEAYPEASAFSSQPVQWEDNIGGTGTYIDGRVLYSIIYQLSTTISGPDMVEAGVEETWHASVTHGTGSYSYQWYIDDSPVGSNSTSHSTSSHLNFEIGVCATDSGTGAVNCDWMNVSTCGGTGQPVCPN